MWNKKTPLTEQESKQRLIDKKARKNVEESSPEESSPKTSKKSTKKKTKNQSKKKSLSDDDPEESTNYFNITESFWWLAIVEKTSDYPEYLCLYALVKGIIN